MQPRVKTGDLHRVYVNPTDKGGFIVLRGASVHMICFTTGDGNFTYKWSVRSGSELQGVPGGNLSDYITSPLEEDTTYACLVENPLLKPGEHSAVAQFVLYVVGRN